MGRSTVVRSRFIVFTTMADGFAPATAAITWATFGIFVSRAATTVIEGRVDFTAYSAIEASLLGLDPRSPKEILSPKK